MSIHRMKYNMKQLTIIIAASLMMLGHAYSQTKAKDQSKNIKEMEQITPGVIPSLR